MKDPKDLLLFQLKEEHQHLKALLFAWRYRQRATFKREGDKVVFTYETPKLPDFVQQMEDRDKALVEEIVRRRKEEEAKWTRTESGS